MDEKHRDAARLTLEGQSQQQIADKYGVSQQSVAKWLARPDVSAFLAALARAQEEETLRVTAHNARLSAQRLCSLSNKLAWRLQLDDGEKDLPTGRPGDLNGYMDKFLAVNREMRETQDALVARRVKLEAHAAAMERHRYEMDAAQEIAAIGRSNSEQEVSGGADLPDNQRTR